MATPRKTVAARHRLLLQELFECDDGSHDPASTTTDQDSDWECETESTSTETGKPRKARGAVAGDCSDCDLDIRMLDDYVVELQEDPVVKSAIDRGLDLRAHSLALSARLRALEDDLVRDYMESEPALRALDLKIASCDSFLLNLSSLLSGFQSDLAAVSGDLRSLLSTNTTLTTSLRAAATADASLASAIDSFVLPPDLVRQLADPSVDPTDPSYIAAIEVLAAKMAFVKTMSASSASPAASGVKSAIGAPISDPNKSALGLLMNPPQQQTQPQQLPAVTIIRAFTDIGPIYEKLRCKCAEKIRSLFVDKIRPISRFPAPNLGMLQSNVLLRLRPLHAFVLRWHPDAALELRTLYVSAVSRFYTTLFEKYIRGILRRLFAIVSESRNLISDDLFMPNSSGAQQAPPGSTLTFSLLPRSIPFMKSHSFSSQSAPTSNSQQQQQQLAAATAATLQPTVFALGERGTHLFSDFDAPVIMLFTSLAHVQSQSQSQTPNQNQNQNQNQSQSQVKAGGASGQLPKHEEDQDGEGRYPIEHVFRSLMRMVVDSSTSEYRFCIEFFHNLRKQLGPPLVIAHAVFQQVLEPTLKAVTGAITGLLATSYDTVGVALCLKIHRVHVQILADRRVSLGSLQHFMNTIEGFVLDRFFVLMDGHVTGVRRLKPSNAASVSSMAQQTSVPHPLFRRYAELCLVLLGLECTELVQPLQMLRTAVEEYLLRLTTGLFPKPKGGTTETTTSNTLHHENIGAVVFLINNYDFVLAATEDVPRICSRLVEVTGTGDSARTSETAHWARLVRHRSMDFVEAAMASDFGFLVQFVGAAETDVGHLDAAQLEVVGTRFTQTWRTSLAGLSVQVVKTFSSYRRGGAVLQMLLDRVAVYWQRYHVLLDKKYKTIIGAETTAEQPPPFKVEPLGAQNLLVEIKKFRAAF